MRIDSGKRYHTLCITEKMIDTIRNETQIGDVITFKQFDGYIHFGGVKRKGMVVEKKDKYCVVDAGGYKECVLWVDMIIQKGAFYGVSEAES